MRYRRLVALLLLVGTVMPAASIAAAPPPATVQVSFMYDYYYYSDSTYTTLVGEAFRSCTGQYTLFWGQSTTYARIVREACG